MSTNPRFANAPDNWALLSSIWLSGYLAVACGQPPSTAPGQDAGPVAVDGPRPIDAAVADAAPDAAVVDAKPDAAVYDAAVLACPGEGQTCGQCGVVTCADAGSVCDVGAPCPLFSEALTVGWPTSQTDYWGSGIAFGDLDDDGAVDALVGAPDGVHALRGDGAGGFSPWPEVMGGPGQGPFHISSLSLADYDGDGDLDLLLTTQMPTPGVHLWQNDGTGRMTDVSAPHDFPGITSPGGSAWADYDGDGDLDVFVAGYIYEPSLLLRNDNGLFTDVAPALGLDDPDAATLQGMWFDFDDDGDQDLIVANDKGPYTMRANRLYRNNGDATFTLLDASAGLTHEVNGMGIAVGDIDEDNDLDLYITDIGFADDGQLLYLNHGDGTFSKVSDEWGAAARTSFGWGAELADLDNDGDLDLVLAASRDGRVYENVGGGFVELVPAMSGAPTARQIGLASADFDNDGRLDLGWWLLDASPLGTGRLAYLARNTAASSNHWLRVRLRASGLNTRGIGATVWALFDNRRLRRAITAGNSFLSASESVAHFGLGATVVVDAVEVRWPDGVITVVPGPIQADQLITVTR